MSDDRHQLLFGPYRTPRFRYSSVVMCELRGEVELVGLREAPIPWPVGRRVGTHGSSRGLVLYGALARAVRLESSLAVAYWWGVTPQTVTVWRRALGVGPTTTGTSVLRARVMLGEHGQRMRNLGRAKARDPERCAKIAAARRGKPRPAYVREAIGRAHTARVHSEEERQKRSEAHKRLGTWPPAAGRPRTEAEDAVVRSLRLEEAAKVLTGRTVGSIRSRRRTLKMPGERGSPEAHQARHSEPARQAAEREPAGVTPGSVWQSGRARCDFP
jgi:hypothetical protein